MYVYLSKILPFSVMPLSVVLLLLLVALLLITRGRRRFGIACLTVSIALLWLASTPWLADSLYGSLERPFPPVALDRVPGADCIVVLGGAVRAPISPRTALDLNESADRVHYAAQLYRAGKAPHVIVTAGNQPWSGSSQAEAELIRDLLVEWGAPRESILIEGGSRNTRENALNTKPLIDSIGCRDPLLVTSAAHMPRALAAFRAVGVSATPVSTDVRVVDRERRAVEDFFPDAAALAMTSEALREWIGRVWYRWKGWA